mgnify:CR=1 FL=1
MVGGRYTLEEVENLIGKKLPLENEVVEDMDHIKQMGPSSSAYPVGEED